MAPGRAEMGSWAMGDYWCPQGPDKRFQQCVKVSCFLPCNNTVFPLWSPLVFEKAAATKGEGGSGTLSDGLLGNDK